MTRRQVGWYHEAVGLAPLADGVTRPAPGWRPVYVDLGAGAGVSGPPPVDVLATEHDRPVIPPAPAAQPSQQFYVEYQVGGDDWSGVSAPDTEPTAVRHARRVAGARKCRARVRDRSQPPDTDLIYECVWDPGGRRVVKVRR